MFRRNSSAETPSDGPDDSRCSRSVGLLSDWVELKVIYREKGQADVKDRNRKGEQRFDSDDRYDVC